MTYPRQVQQDAPWGPDDFRGVISPAAMRTHLVLHANYADRYNAARRQGAMDTDLDFDFGGVILHNLFWNSIRPRGSRLTGLLKQKVEKTFGSERMLLAALRDAAGSIQGSGWVLLSWLHDTDVRRRGTLSIRVVPNQDWREAVTAAPRGLMQYTPLLALDVWEHAWFLDHGADKARWFKIWGQIIDWRGADGRLQALLAEGVGRPRQMALL